MKIAIAGAGAMGRWLIDRLAPQQEVGWWDPFIAADRESVIGTRLDTPEELARWDPDLLVNCVSLNRTIPVFESFLPHLPSRTILADIASIKGPLVEWYRKTGRPFLSVHPLFGPLFGQRGQGRAADILLVSESDPGAGCWLKETFAAPDFNIREISFADHDPAMRYTLGLPMLLSLLGLELLPMDCCLGTGLRAFMQHGQTVLCESPELLSAVLAHALSSDLAVQIGERMAGWRQEIEKGSLIDGLRENLRQKLDHFRDGGQMPVVS